MIVHLVMLKLNEDCRLLSNEIKRRTIADIKEKLESMPLRIKEIKFLEVGVNYSNEERSMELSLYAKFDSKKDLDNYLKNGYHIKVSAFIDDMVEYTKLVDYEIN